MARLAAGHVFIPMHRQTILPILTLYLALGVSWVALSPGLSGDFMFDDFATLPSLGATGEIDSFRELVRYLAEGHTGPSGRPIALLSFLIDDHTWPSSAAGFKLTNILLHILNGALLSWALFLLLRSLKINSDTQNSWTAVIAASIWMLHPFFVSTTLYVVQRMAILATTGFLIALVGYLKARSRVDQNPAKGAWLMAFWTITGTTIATLSKENGALTPALILILEYTILASSRIDHGPPKLTRALVLWTPAASIFAYLLWRGLASWPNGAGYEHRPFSLPERLISQVHALFDYVTNLLIPRVHYPGLFSDFSHTGTGLLFSTALFSISLLGIVAGSIILRKRAPFISAAILFFIVGHSVESTVIPLELYYEHRNYLPALLLGLPLANGLLRLPLSSILTASLTVALLALLAALTAARADLWGDPDTLYHQWAQAYPDSQRAQRAAAIALERRGRYRDAVVIVSRAVNRHPENAVLRTHQLVLACNLGVERSQNRIFAELVSAVRTRGYEQRAFEQLEGVVRMLLAGECKNLSPETASALIDALAHASDSGDGTLRRFQIAHMRALVDLNQDRPTAAATHFREAFYARPDVESGLYQAARLASAGAYEAALENLQMISDFIDAMPHHKRVINHFVWEPELSSVRKSILADLKGNSK